MSPRGRPALSGFWECLHIADACKERIMELDGEILGEILEEIATVRGND
jgi:hypothetical protein